MQELNIVELIEKNPISKLSNAYNNKLINKIKDNFNDFESQLFVSSFYCYLNYDKNIDFVVDLDDIWKWLEFSQKIHPKRLLEKYFKLDIDYKNSNILYELSDKNRLTLSTCRRANDKLFNICKNDLHFILICQ